MEIANGARRWPLAPVGAVLLAGATAVAGGTALSAVRHSGQPTVSAPAPVTRAPKAPDRAAAPVGPDQTASTAPVTIAASPPSAPLSAAAPGPVPTPAPVTPSSLRSAAAPTSTAAAWSPNAVVAQAETMIRYPWPQLGYEVVVAPARPGYFALTSNIPKRIRLYVRPNQSPRDVAFVLAHEIGHAVDFSTLSDADRATWDAARAFTGRAWYGCNDCDDLSTPAGDFAESFADWQVGAEGRFASKLGPPPTPAQKAVLARLTSRG